MKGTLLPALLAAAMAMPLQASAIDNAVNTSWIQWNGSSGSLTQNATAITASFTGATVNGNNAASGDYFSYYTGAYLSGTVGNSPANNGFLQFAGGNTTVHHIQFSSAVINPLLAIVSLGQGGATASFAFQNVTSIDILSEGQGAYGDGTLATNGGTVTGVEGHGVVRLNGTYTDLYFTTPTYEFWYGATFGAAVTAVPEPGNWAMLLVGGSVLGLAGRRRRNEKLTHPA